MDISTEIAAIQAASQGSELRQPLVGALNKLNSGSLPTVTASDAGKILKVGANGWEVGEKSGYMPVPSASLIISSNNTYDVTNYAEALVNVPSGMGSGVLVNPAFQGLSYGYIKSDGNGFSSYNTRRTYLNIFEVIANHQYALYVGETVGNRRRASFFSGKSISDFSPYLVAPAEDTLIFDNGIWLAPFEQNVDDSDNALTGRIVYTPNTNGVIVYATDNNTQIIPAYCVDMSASSTLVQKTITQNGTYDPADDNADGYSEVIVNVASNAAVFSPDYKYTLQSSGDPVFSQRNGEMCLTRQGSARAVYVFSKIPSFAKKLCIAIEIVDYSSQYWRGAQVGRKANNTLPASGGWDATRLAFFTNSDTTAESINEQSGVTINSTSNVNLSKQTVEIDISDINEDFYPFIQTQNQVMYLYSIYYTV